MARAGGRGGGVGGWREGSGVGVELGGCEDFPQSSDEELVDVVCGEFVEDKDSTAGKECSAVVGKGELEVSVAVGEAQGS